MIPSEKDYIPSVHLLQSLLDSCEASSVARPALRASQELKKQPGSHCIYSLHVFCLHQSHKKYSYENVDFLLLYISSPRRRA